MKGCEGYILIESYFKGIWVACAKPLITKYFRQNPHEPSFLTSVLTNRVWSIMNLEQNRIGVNAVLTTGLRRVTKEIFMKVVGTRS